jgi:hypothetical protein
MKEQFAVRLVPQFFCHVSHLNLLSRSSFESVENNLDGSQALPAAQSFLEEHADELILNAPTIRRYLCNPGAQGANQSLRARPAVGISRLARQKILARNSAELLPLAALFAVIFHVAYLRADSQRRVNWRSIR